MPVETIKISGTRGFLLLVLVFAPLTVETTLGEESDGSGFHKAIRQIAQARSRIHSYDVTVTGKVHNSVERVRATDGSWHEVEKVPICFTLKMLFDEERAILFVARRDVYRSRSTGKEETSKWQLLGKTFAEIRNPDGSLTGPGQSVGYVREFFDPLGLGISWEGEIRRGTSWEKTVANYLKWEDDFEVRNVADGQVAFENRNFSIVIDTLRDQWPIEMTSRQGSQLHIKTSIQLVKIHDFWLPASATVTRPQEMVELQFEWHSVNAPIPQERFMARDIESRFGSLSERK